MRTNLPQGSLTGLPEWCTTVVPLAAGAQEAYRKYDELANRHVETLRRLTKSIQDARIARDHDAIKRAITAYDAALEGYIPGLMAMAKIYWDMENYAQVLTRAG
jgi:tetratricopeptide repeat protein 30